MAALGLLFLLFSSQTRAATRTWDGLGADANWSTAANWGGTAPVAADALVFGGTTQLGNTNDLAALTSFAGLTFNSTAGAFTLSGNSITLAGTVTNGSTNLQTINLDMAMTATRTFSMTTGGGDLVLGGILSGAFGLTTAGAGTLTLNGANTYTGTTTIAAGTTLKLGSATALGTTAGTTAITGTLDLNGQTIVGENMSMGANSSLINSNTSTNASSSGTIGGGANTITLGGAGNLTVSGAITSSTTGTIVKSGAGTVTLSASNTAIDGAVRIDAGTLNVASSSNSLGDTTNRSNVQLNGGNLSITNDAALALNNNLTLTAAAGSTTTITLDRVTAGAGATHTMSGGTFTMASGGTLNVVGGANVTSGTEALTLGGTTFSGAETFNIVNPAAGGLTQLTVGTITNATNASVTKLGSGDLVTSGTVAFGGTGGAIDVQAGRIGWSAGSGTITESGVISGAGGIIKTGSSIVNLTTAETFTGGITMGGGTLGYTSIVDGGDITFTGSSTLSFNGATDLTVNRNIVATGGSPTLVANGSSGAVVTYTAPVALAGNGLTLSGSGNGVISGSISNSGGGNSADITKTGTGTWTLSAPTTMDDDIIVNQGTLVLNAVNAHSGDSLYARGDGTVIKLGVNGALSNVAPGMNNLYIGDSNGTVAGGGTSTVDLNGTTGSTVNTIQLGSAQYTTAGLPSITYYNGAITDSVGGGSISGTSLDLRSGTVSGDVIIAGAGTLTKQTAGSVTISGTITPSSGVTNITGGSLILDYTTENTNKLNSAGQLQASGGSITLIGNAAAPTTQTVAGLNLNALGTTDIEITPGAGGATTLDIGTITRSAGSTVNFVLPNANAIVTTTAANTNGIIGAYATVTTADGQYFASNTGGQIAAATTYVADDLTRQWPSTLVNQNVTDGAGFTGTTDCMSVNSLRIGAGSALNVRENLNIVSGGLLVASTSTSSGISGGTLTTSGGTELIVTQNSSTDFTISSDIRSTNTSVGSEDITKTGTGNLILSGNNYTGNRSTPNSASGTLRIAEGTVTLSGGRALSDNTAVILESLPGATLKLASDETVGAISGGGVDGGVIDIGANTLTTASAGSYAGTFVGSGKIVKTNLGPAAAYTNFNLTANNPGFTGTVDVKGGLFQLSGSGISNLTGVTAWTVNKGGDLLIDNNGASSAAPGQERIGDTASVTLNGANGGWNTQTSFRGLAIRTDQNGTRGETIGALTVNSGANYATLESSNSSTNTGSVSIITAASLTRNNNATLSIRGTNLGTTSAVSRTRLQITTTGNADETFGNLYRLGGTNANGGTAAGTNSAGGTKNISIVPWAIGEVLGTTSAPGTLAGTNVQTGNSLVTFNASYGAATNYGFRPLDLATEYSTYTASSGTGNGDNVRESLNGADVTGLTSKTINALVINNQGTTANKVSGAGAGAAMAITTGTMLFTGVDSAGAQLATQYGITVDGFDGGITTATGEYTIFQNNMASAGVTIASPLSTAGSKLTKSGLGLLTLSAVNASGSGGVTLNEGTLQISDLDNIGGSAGALTFAGGTLKLGSGWGDDLSSRTITVLGAADGTGNNNGAWGKLDTNGISTTFTAGNISGTGEFVKTGVGTLTLGAATGTTHTGTFVVEQTGSGTTSAGVAQLILNNTGGNAIGGNLQIGAYTLPSSNGTAVVQLARANQIVDTGLLSFNGAGSKNGYFKMAGFSETVAGIQDTSGAGVIENVESETTSTIAGANTNAVLTLAGGGDYYYNGYIRNRSGGTATGTIGLTMSGSGSQTLAGTNILYTGPTTISSGLVRLRDTTGFASDIINNSKLELERTNSTTWNYSKVISGSGDVIKTGVGTGVTNLTGVNTYTGITEVQAGTLNLTTGGSINDSRAIEIKPGATFDVSTRTGASYTYDGQLSGEGTVKGSIVLSNNVGAVNGTGMLSPGCSTNPTAAATPNATTGNELGTLTFSSGSLTLNGGAGGAGALMQVYKPTLNDSASVLASLAAGNLNLAAGAPPVSTWDSTTLLDAAGLPSHDSVNFTTGGMIWNTGSTIKVDPTPGYVGVFGDVIDLFDWVTAMTGNGDLGDVGSGIRAGGLLGDLDLPTLSSGLFWDVSLFKSNGVIVVVPEPSRAMLLLTGLTLVISRRRRTRCTQKEGARVC